MSFLQNIVCNTGCFFKLSYLYFTSLIESGRYFLDANTSFTTLLIFLSLLKGRKFLKNKLCIDISYYM